MLSIYFTIIYLLSNNLSSVLHFSSSLFLSIIVLIIGKLHIVDLAGSERVSMSGVTGSCAYIYFSLPVLIINIMHAHYIGMALKETQAINLSLTALGM
jgi:hypothetical protein